MKSLENNYKPVIVVVAYNRVHSLNRLLLSLSQAQYPEDVKLIISIDRGENNQDVVELAHRFEWNFGEKEVLYRPENLGLRKHILSCGDMTEKYGSVILLEDDLYVSPCFYRFSQEATNYYADDDRIAGIGLYTNQMNSYAGFLPFIPVEDGSDVFFFQAPCSWGQVWNDKKWRKFRDWYNEGPKISDQDRFPKPIKNWPESSWLKYHIKYVVEKDLYYVYPRISHSTNFGDSGVHFDKQVNMYQVNLQYRKKTYTFQTFDEALAVYDIFYEILPSRLSQMVPALAAYKYVVDIYGTKNLGQYEEEYVLTKTPAVKPVFSFGMQFRPFVMNIINQLPGKSLFFAHKDQLLSPNGSAFGAFRYYYGHLQPRPLVNLLKIRLKERKPFSILFK
ncbi:MAG: glycosyltransferase family 2 protein [Bacteroidia bacterium]|nr:glycosyltransferase family 2 protein [Bacteroidia bacterium]